MNEEQMIRALILCPASLMKSHLMANMKGVSFIEHTDEGREPQVVVLVADYLDFMTKKPDFERYADTPWVVIGTKSGDAIETEMQRHGIIARFLETKAEADDIGQIVKKVAGLKRSSIN